MSKTGFVYIMTSKNRNVLYVGVTNDLQRRINEHKNHPHKKSFTARYNVEYCVYYEEYALFEEAINREKQIKGMSRKKKEALINKINPNWEEISFSKKRKFNYKPFSEQVKDVLKTVSDNEDD